MTQSFMAEAPMAGLVAQGPLPAGMLRIHQGNLERYVWPVHLSGWLALGWRVALNQPYAGGWTTQSWGRPSEGFHAIQVELNRALYFDEAARMPGPGWSRTEKGVARAIAALLDGT